MLNELEKNGLSINILNEISYKSSLGKNLKNSLRKFSKEELFDEVRTMIRYYTEIETLDEVDLDYRIKSLDSCLRKYDKYYPEMQVEKVFNDILGFRMLVDDYNTLINSNTPEGVRMVDMSRGKSNDDGYRGVHIYFQPNHYYYPIEIQANTYYDRQLNNWLHKFLYKRGYTCSVGKALRQEYECGRILNEHDFEEVLKHVLSSSKEI